jgi:hypothetical protein
MRRHYINKIAHTVNVHSVECPRIYTSHHTRAVHNGNRIRA